MRRLIPWFVGLCLSGSLWATGGGQGISARIVPDQVRPGELFELQVEMERGEYARFELRIPEQDRLHRVAVESVPVMIEDGRYRQSERWLLQADSSGEVLIEGGSVLLDTGDGEVVVELPPLRLEVLPFAGADSSSEPAGLPAEAGGAGTRRAMFWLLVLGGGIAGAGLLLVGIFRIRRGGWNRSEVRPSLDSWLEPVLEELANGKQGLPALERLMDERGRGWSVALREEAEQAVYAGRADSGRLATMLREEVGR